MKEKGRTFRERETRAGSGSLKMGRAGIWAKQAILTEEKGKGHVGRMLEIRSG